MGSLTILLMNKLNVMSADKINTATHQSINKNIIKLFYRNQMHHNYELDENILKTLIKRRIFPTDPDKK